MATTSGFERRAICLGLAAAALAGPQAANAQGAPGAAFEGTWGGAQGEVTAQVIIAGGEIIGFYWRGDYTDARDATPSADGRSLSFTFDGGSATLTLTGDRAAAIVITEGARISRLTLARD
jgi:hypothetical protein